MARMGEPISCGQVNTRPRPLKKTYIRVPAAHIRVPATRTSGLFQRSTRVLAGAILSLFYWGLAGLRGGPGLPFRWRCAVLALHLIRKRTPCISASDLYRLLFSPIDSVRYFEFEFIGTLFLRCDYTHTWMSPHHDYFRYFSCATIRT